MSVPHSGTRTLVEHLGERVNLLNQGIRDGRWWHFGSHDDNLRRYKVGTVHIPIRHPLAVAASWAHRTAAGNRTGDPKTNMVKRYRKMFEFLADPHLAIEFHRMEDLPVLQGKDEHDYCSELVPEFCEAVVEYVLAPNKTFFAQFYEESNGGQVLKRSDFAGAQ